jgi:hypothetical protein
VRKTSRLDQTSVERKLTNPATISNGPKRFAGLRHQADSNPRAIHLWAARQLGAGRRDAAGRLVETGPMKKRLLISALVFAALLLALYGVMFGTGAK